jgi:hypothetical protein
MVETKQKQITDPTNPNQLPKKLELTQPPKPTIPTTPIQQPTQPPKPKQPLPQIPKDIQIICNFFEEVEGAAYHARQTLYQQYGPVDYTPITDIELEFTEEQASKLVFEQQDEKYIIKPKMHLEINVFADIAKRVRELGGQYVSAGKDSHFQIKKQ